jgi:hypothetical protein
VGSAGNNLEARLALKAAGTAESVAENRRLRALIKVLCSDPSPYGSEAFQRTRDTVSFEYKVLLLDVLSDGSGAPRG